MTTPELINLNENPEVLLKAQPRTSYVLDGKTVMLEGFKTIAFLTVWTEEDNEKWWELDVDSEGYPWLHLRDATGKCCMSRKEMVELIKSGEYTLDK